MVMNTEQNVLAGLVEQVREAVADPRYQRLKEMWTRHNRLEKVAKVPVSIHLHGGYPVVWQELIPPGELLCKEPLARAVELQLRQKMYRHRFIPDDNVLLPTVWLNPVKPTTSGTGSFQEVRATGGHEISSGQGAEHSELVEMAQLWGLPFKVQQTSASGGAYKVEPVVTTEDDMAQLRHAEYLVDEKATQELVERATELTGGVLPVKIASDEVRASPSETVVSLMGMEAILYGVYDHPELLHKMMDFITDGTIAYHRSRQTAGAVDAETGEWHSRITESQARQVALADFAPTATVTSVTLIEENTPLEFRGGLLPVYQVVLDHPKNPHYYVCPVKCSSGGTGPGGCSISSGCCTSWTTASERISTTGS